MLLAGVPCHEPIQNGARLARPRNFFIIYGTPNGTGSAVVLSQMIDSHNGEKPVGLLALSGHRSSCAALRSRRVRRATGGALRPRPFGPRLQRLPAKFDPCQRTWSSLSRECLRLASESALRNLTAVMFRVPHRSPSVLPWRAAVTAKRLLGALPFLAIVTLQGAL